MCCYPLLLFVVHACAIGQESSSTDTRSITWPQRFQTGPNICLNLGPHYTSLTLAYRRGSGKSRRGRSSPLGPQWVSPRWVSHSSHLAPWPQLPLYPLWDPRRAPAAQRSVVQGVEQPDFALRASHKFAPLFVTKEMQLSCHFPWATWGIANCGQFSSVTQSYLTLRNPMDCNKQGFPVHHQLPKLAQIHVHWVGDAMQPSHPLSSPSPPAFNLSQHQGLFQWVSPSHQVAKVLEFWLQHQSF